MQHYLAPLAGGVLIGLACLALLLGNGRIAGISGIVGSFVDRTRGDLSWRVLFIGGMVLGGAIMNVISPAAFASATGRAIDGSYAFTIVSGVLVGFGTRLGSGCTSGHGVCGIGRLSTRSLVATMTFIATGVITVAVIDALLGGAS